MIERKHMDAVTILVLTALAIIILACVIYWRREDTDAAKGFTLQTDNRNLILAIEKRLTEREALENSRYEQLQGQILEVKLQKQNPVHLVLDTKEMAPLKVTAIVKQAKQKPLFPAGAGGAVSVDIVEMKSKVPPIPNIKPLLERAGVTKGKHLPRENN